MEIRKNTMDISKLSVEDFIRIKNEMDNAENDDTPYAVVVDNQIQVIGDSNKTEVKKGEYTIHFMFPNREEWKEALKESDAEIIRESPNYIIAERHYKDVWVSPRYFNTVQTSFLELYRFYVTTNDDGSLRDMTIDEIIDVLQQLDQEVVDAMCKVVASVLKIPASYEEFMALPTVVDSIVQMIRDFPEIMNGTDFFTDRSPEMVSE